MKNPVVWFEVMGKDLAKLQGFYRELFAWPLEDVPEMPYAMMEKTPEGIPGGVGAAPEGPGWGTTFYVQVEDLKASLAQAEKLGGKVLMPPTKIPDATIAVIADPEGHPVGLTQPA